MYKGKVVKINTSPHPNADRLQLGSVQGIQVIVGLDTQNGEVGVFFPCDGQLSQEFLTLHNLYRHAHLNENTNKTGYFSDNGRVTVEKIRGERSDGFWCPLHYFEYTGADLDKLQLGDELNELNGHKICQKYYTPATKRAMSKRGKKSWKTQADYNLPRHYNTEQLQYNYHKVEQGDLVIITEKAHGTSTRMGYVQVEREINLSWWQRLYNKIPFLPNFLTHTRYYEFCVGTRNTIANDWVQPDSSDYYRLELAKPLEGALKKGEVIYAEIVGFDSNGKPIMNPQPTSRAKNKKLIERYGDTMMYTYGCAWNDVNKPQRDLYVYRITQVNEDGIEHELSWAQIKKRCLELNLKWVPEIDKGIAQIYVQSMGIVLEQNKYRNNLDFQWVIEESVKGTSLLDTSHIREGVCVRLEKANGQTVVLKHKSFEFKLLEGILKADDNYVDTEEVS